MGIQGCFQRFSKVFPPDLGDTGGPRCPTVPPSLAIWAPRPVQHRDRSTALVRATHHLCPDPWCPKRRPENAGKNVGKWWNMWKIRWKIHWKIHKHICEIMWTYVVNIQLMKKMQKGSTCRNKWGLDFINFYFSRLIMNICVSKQLCQGQVSILHCCWLFPFRSTAYSFHFVW